MIAIIKRTAFRYGYLFIVAAWLYTFSFIFTNYFSYTASEKKVSDILEKYTVNQEEVFERLIKDSSVIKGLIADGPAVAKKQLLTDALGMFVYQVNDLGNPVQLYWNTDKMAPEAPELQKTDGYYAASYENGLFEFIKQTIHYNNRAYYFCCMIPLRWDYFMRNNYLKPEFAGYPEFSANYEIPTDGSGTAVKNGKGDVLFYIKEKFTISHDNPGVISMVMRIAALVIFLVFLKKIAAAIVNEKGLLKGLSFLVVTVGLLRLASYFLPFPFNLRSLELFNPIVYASSGLHPSLGDLLINAMLAFWFIIFIRHHYKSRFTLLNNDSREARVIAAICLCLLPFAALECANLISSLVRDSTISLDALNFFSLSIFTFTSFLIICLLVYVFFYLSGFLIFISGNSISLYWQVIIIVSASLALVTLNPFTLPQYINIIVSAWLVLYFFLAKYLIRDKIISFTSNRYFIFWGVFLMASAAAIVTYENSKKETEARIRIADKIDEQTDAAGESLLSMAFNFPDDFLPGIFNRFYAQYDNKFLKDSLANMGFSGYQNKFDTRIYTFDAGNKPLYNEDSTSYDVIVSIIENRGKETKVPGLYYYENAADRFSYIYRKELPEGYNGQKGSLFIVAKPKVYKNEALVPELFKQLSDPLSYLGTSYSYAVYNRQHLITNLNNYNFSDTISAEQVPKFQYLFRNVNGYSELWYKAGNSKVIVVTRKNHSFIAFVTLFAYLFLLFIFTALTLRSAELLYETRLQADKLRALFRLNIRSRIQATIIGLTIFSFLVIGFVTISFFILRFNKDSRGKLINIAQIMVNEIETDIKSELVFNDMLNLNDAGLSGDVERKVIEIADIHKTDVNLYTTSGDLIVSSQANIYNRKVLSDKMPPGPFFALNYQRSIQLITRENIGSFKYMSLYVPVRDEKGTPIGYLNIPYLNSQKELNQEISNFLVMLIDLNALIFILAGTIAILLTTRITSSFQLISSKMKEVSLGKNNEAIEWKSHDEIGTLVAEYNKMVAKLEESANALARSEREGAWREMARQVAHEIKNPLTPMKLSIQYLQKAMQDNSVNTKPLAAQVSQTLIEQIDQLAKIAGDFSQFANITNVNPETFNLLAAMESMISLYKTDERLSIQLSYEPGNYLIYSDKTQINRLFTNLVKNAVEASDEQERIAITMSLHTENGNIVAAIRDHGQGIPEAMHARIFQPNFTTKSSGTGLGLAICKAIVEKANGRIWFTTSHTEGSCFYVSLPQV